MKADLALSELAAVQPQARCALLAVWATLGGQPRGCLGDFWAEALLWFLSAQFVSKIGFALLFSKHTSKGKELRCALS